MLNLMQIELLLHYYWSPEEHPYVQEGQAGVRECIDGLKREGLLTLRNESDGCSATYSATERAKVYAEAIRSLPLPVQSWAMP